MRTRNYPIGAAAIGAMPPQEPVEVDSIHHRSHRMNPAALRRGQEATGPILFRVPPSVSHVAHWTINGFPASIVVWTVEEWDRLAVHPDDAQYYACGVWCALRL